MVSNTPKGTGRPEKSRCISLKPRKLDFTPVVDDLPDNLVNENIGPSEDFDKTWHEFSAQLN